MKWFYVFSFFLQMQICPRCHPGSLGLCICTVWLYLIFCSLSILGEVPVSTLPAWNWCAWNCEGREWKKIKNRKIKYSLWVPLGCVSCVVYQTHKSNFKMVFAGYKHMTLKLDRYAALQAFSALCAYPWLTVGSFWSGSWSEPPHDPGSVSTALLVCYSTVPHFIWRNMWMAFKFNIMGIECPHFSV